MVSIDRTVPVLDPLPKLPDRLALAVGWGSDQGIGGFGEEPGIKAQLMNLIRSVRTVMRVPLIAVNSITIVLLLLFG
ncbi:PREDICTED: immediate early response 3-interacting protein 1 [Aptenodytes forsteri]|uniref:immediate early response 3-interacting protein 1 n=1 Tax=Aptenodytes forsteri TaxID=9233 RepID=UPI0004F47906|nr:PREDICTED: immediate early response 3-interacting protein 1 [Aptenodytes forsteri]